MKSMVKKGAAIAASVASGAAMAAADPLVTAGVTTAGTAFSDNFGAVFSWYVGIVVTLAAAAMLIKYIKRAK